MFNRHSLAALFMLMATARFARAETLAYTGCDVAREAFMDSAVAAFEKKTGVHVTLEEGGDAVAIKAVKANAKQLGGVCRELFDDKDEADLRLIHVGWGALALVVNAENPIGKISIEGIRKVFDGQVTNWKELGGKDLPIHAVARKPGKFSGVGYSTRVLIFGDIGHNYSPSVKLVQSTTSVQEEIAGDVDAVGFSDVSSVKKQPKLRIVPIDNVVPTKQSIATGRYKLVRPLFLVVHKDYKTANATLQKFLDFILSAEGQTLVSTEGVVSLEQGAALKKSFAWQNKKVILNF